MLTTAGLAAAIVAAQDAVSPAAETDSGISGAAVRQENAQALADAIVGYLLANAVVVGVCPPGGGPLTGGKLT